MCGIAGIIVADTNALSQERLKKMTDSIAHRGPDGEGHWINESGQVGLGNRRLSILDLHPRASQPLHYLDRYTITFNGAIYNYIELKEGLQQAGYQFSTTGDTEVLLALYHRDREKCLDSLDGMFAFAIYDRVVNTVFAARDRYGEKPFYYSYTAGQYFLFGSEMKCLWAAGIQKRVNNRMLYNYLDYGYISNPADPSETFYEHCINLEPGHYLLINANDCTLRTQQYYDINWKNINESISVEKAGKQFQELFQTSILRRLRSDVTVGSSLSGGLDSSLVVTTVDALNKSDHPQHSFSAVFPGFLKDERSYIDQVVAATSLIPHFVTPDAGGLAADLSALAYQQEEPWGSSSIYVQYRVMQLARENKVTVLLDGQGADELLAGYHSFYGPYFKEQKKTKGSNYQREIAAYKKLHNSNSLNPAERSGLRNQLKKLAGNQTGSLRKLYHRYKQTINPILHKDFYQHYRQAGFDKADEFDNLNQALYHSFKTGLTEMLRYADRNSMAFGREVRLPFLNQELVDFVFSLPADFKIHDGWTKWIMRESSKHLLPPAICWRVDKIAYEAPQEQWMKTAPLRERISDAKNNLEKLRVLRPGITQLSAEYEWRVLIADAACMI